MSDFAHLLPSSARPTGGGLSVGGCDLAELAERFGTPLVVYDEHDLRARCRAARDAFPDGVFYAGKAFLSLAIAQLVHEEGLGIDVASLGEMEVALAAGVPASSLVLHGSNKSTDELRAAAEVGLGRVVVDSFDDVARLGEVVARAGLRPADVLVRLNPAVHVPTHPSVSTGHATSRFGLRVDNGEAAAALEQVAEHPHLRLRGVHVHAGSQILDLRAVQAAVSVAARLARDTGVDELSVGGGLGVAYTRRDAAPTIAEWGRAVASTVRRTGFAGRVTAEPGRSVVARAGLTVYRVGTVKEVPGAPAFVGVDGGLSDNPRPALYGSEYEAFLLRSPRPVGAGAAGRRVTVVGKTCESGDVLVRDTVLPADLRRDDLLAVPVTGAYVHAMSSRYNKLPRPAVVLVADGAASLVVRRETTADLLRHELPLTGPAPASVPAPARRTEGVR